MSGSQVDPANAAIYEPIRQPVQSFPVLRIGFILCFIACWRISHRKEKTFSLLSKPFVFPLADSGCPRHLAKYRGKPGAENYMGKIPKTVRLRRGYRVWSDYGCAESAGGVMHSFDADMDCNYL